MPSYNNSAFIKQSIESVLSQNYSNIELIVIDDGSTDNSIEILSEYQGRIILSKQENKGAAAARNHGIRLATGDFICFLDSDDIWLQGKIKAQINFLLNNPDFIACYCGWKSWDGKKIPLDTESNDPEHLQIDQTGWIYLQLLKSSIISTITVLMKAEIVKKVGFFDESLIVGEDHDYWLRLSRLGKIAKLKNNYSLYRRNINSITRKMYFKNYSLIVLENNVKKFGLIDPAGNSITIETYNNYVADRHFLYGYFAFWLGFKNEATSAFLQSFKNKNYRLKSLIYLLSCRISFIYKIIVERKQRKLAKIRSENSEI
jgi:glycosyltransferase involved in cell wall biosynthesis